MNVLLLLHSIWNTSIKILLARMQLFKVVKTRQNVPILQVKCIFWLLLCDINKKERLNRQPS